MPKVPTQAKGTVPADGGCLGVRILLIDVDSKMPNLALRKLWAWHEKRGDEVRYLYGSLVGLYAHVRFDKVYISCIFTKNAEKARKIAKLFPNAEVGGYAVNGAKLPDEIEHTMPNYYGMDFSMGFTSRGCPRRCEFCPVPKTEGGIRDHAPIQEFHNPDHKKIMLLDNNILASPRWRENWHYVSEQDLKVCVTQGLDARLITEESAGMIADTKCYDTKFKHKCVYTAWDNPADETAVLRGIQRLLDAGVRGPSTIVYELVDYDTSLEQDLYRFNTLVKMGVRPFVMPYNGKRDHPMVRWGQRAAIYMRITFHEYQRLKDAGIAHPEARGLVT